MTMMRLIVDEAAADFEIDFVTVVAEALGL